MREPLRLVAQLLLVMCQAVEIAHRLIYRLRRRVPILLPGLLQIFERVLQLLEHFLRVFLVAGIGHLHHVVDHRLQILPGDGLRGVGRARAFLLTLLCLAGREFAQELVHRRAQIVGQLADFILRGIALQSVA